MGTQKDDRRVISILSITSDIGTALAKRYAEEGSIIIGTYRSSATDAMNILRSTPDCHLFYCDISNKKSVDKFAGECRDLSLKWDTFISCPGTQKPIGNFFDCDFQKWSNSIHVNAIEQLRVLHKLYPFRNPEKISNAVFFAGGGTNNAFPNYSAYTISKIMLIKMCELIDSENNDLNTFIIGPGFTKTKMHYETLNEQKEKAGPNYDKTYKMMKENAGTSMDDIFNCIEWLCNQGREVAGGRNFSVVYDKWGNSKLSEILKEDANMYKLRRSGNNIKIE